jgi:hypothetical protein
LELHHDEIEAAGLKIVAIGLGQPKHARRFGDKLAPSVECVTREEPDLHATYGIGKGDLLRLISPDAIRAGARAAAQGHKQGEATGDTRRLPGTFIVDSNGIVCYAYYGKYAGDNPDLPELLRVWQESRLV